MDNLQKCLSNNMKYYRKQKNFSQEKLAEKAGASSNYIALIENGKYFPSLPMLQQIAKALEIDTLDLFNKKGLEYQNLNDLRLEVIEKVTNEINSLFKNKTIDC